MIRSQFPCSRFCVLGLLDGERENLDRHGRAFVALGDCAGLSKLRRRAYNRNYGWSPALWLPLREIYSHQTWLQAQPAASSWRRPLVHIEEPFSWTWPFLPGTDLHPVMPRAMNLSTVDFYGSLAFIGTHSVIAPTIPLQSSQGRRCRTVGLPHRQSAVMAQSKQTERVFWQFANASSSPAMTVAPLFGSHDSVLDPRVMHEAN